jgi:hypothetical protein
MDIGYYMRTLYAVPDKDPVPSKDKSVKAKAKTAITTARAVVGQRLRARIARGYGARVRLGAASPPPSRYTVSVNRKGTR